MSRRSCLRRLAQIVLLIVLLAAIVAGVAVRKFLWIQPYPGPQEGEFEGVTSRPSPDPYRTEWDGSTYEERRRDFLERLGEKGGNYDKLGGLMLGKGELSDEEIQKNCDRIRGREDCADFTAARLVRFLAGFGDHPLVKPEQRDAVAEAMKGFKFWKDQGGEGKMIMETENHQILFNSCEYLMGQLYPDDVFPNDGKTGRWHQEHARTLILKWMDRRIRFGFAEWDSNVYYNETLPAVTNLAEYAEDERIATQAAMILDLLLFDMASDLYQGAYATSHGRTYTKEMINGRQDHLRDLVWLAFGLGEPRAGGFAGVALATSNRYQPPVAIQRVAQLVPEVYVGKERHGITVEKAPEYGFDYDDPENIFFFWEMGAYTSPQVVETSMRMTLEWEMWDQPFFEDMAFLEKPTTFLLKAKLLPVLFRYPLIKSHQTVMGEVHKLTYRTPDYQLSTAQCYRPGELANQHFIWNAILDPDAIVFVSHPGTLNYGGMTPAYWGNGRLPKACQHGPVHISIYRIGPIAAIGERALYGFTHAFFPKWAFDEISERDNWIFGRRRDGYVALRCSRPLQWTTEGRDAGTEIVAEGREAIWICQCGRKKTYESFKGFQEAVTGAELMFHGTSVTYEAPQVGLMDFSWSGPLNVDGRTIETNDYPRIDNPYCHAEFGAQVYDIRADGHRVYLDFKNLVRRVE